MGVSSYLLIGFYYTKPESVAASKKAFIVTRFADLGFLIGILIYGYCMQTFTFTPSEEQLMKAGMVLPWALGLMFTHAMFKALIFLGAGCVIHAVHSNEMSFMGGLRKYMPVTHITFLIACLAIAGIPPFSGFFSKDEILTVCFRFSPVAGWIMTIIAGMTAFYMFRLYYCIFRGKDNNSASREQSQARLNYAEAQPVQSGKIQTYTMWFLGGIIILTAGTLLVFMQEGEWISSPDTRHKAGEFYVITISTLLGMYFMVSAGSFILFYVGLELASIPMACLIAFDKWKRHSAEAGAKFILYSIFSSGLMLYGLSLVYGTCGTTYFADMAHTLTGTPLQILAMVFFFAGLGFKLSLVPFHMWTPVSYMMKNNSEIAYNLMINGSSMQVYHITTYQAMNRTEE